MKKIVLFFVFTLMVANVSLATCEYSGLHPSFRSADGFAKVLKERGCSSYQIAFMFDHYGKHFSAKKGDKGPRPYKKYTCRSEYDKWRCNDDQKKALKALNNASRRNYILEEYETRSELRARSAHEKASGYKNVSGQLEKISNAHALKAGDLEKKRKKLIGEIDTIRKKQAEIKKLHEDIKTNEFDIDQDKGDYKATEKKLRRLYSQYRVLKMRTGRMRSNASEIKDEATGEWAEVAKLMNEQEALEGDINELLSFAEDMEKRVPIEKASYARAAWRKRLDDMLTIADEKFKRLKDEEKLYKELIKDIDDVEVYGEFQEEQIQRFMDKAHAQIQRSMLGQYVNSQIALLAEEICKGLDEFCKKKVKDKDLYNKYFKWLNASSRGPKIPFGGEEGDFKPRKGGSVKEK